MFWILLSLSEGHLQKGITGFEWVPIPTLLDLVTFYIVPFGYLPDYAIKPVIPRHARVLIPLIAMIISFLILKYRGINRRNVIMLGAIALFGPAVFLAVSRNWPFSIWAPRQMVGPLIAFVVIVGIALTLVKSWAKILLGFILIAWCIVNVPNGFPETLYPPYRFIASLILEKYPGVEVFVQERFIGTPLEYYLNKKVNYFKNNGDIGSSEQAIFVCRSAQCDKLGRIKLDYSLLETRTINWWGENWAARKKEHDSSIEIHFLRKMQ
jgi:hypothetical protein